MITMIENAVSDKPVFRRSNDLLEHEEILCPVGEGGIMLMHPLLFHASGKSTGAKPRRVLHIEFSNQPLPDGLQWSERS